MLVVKVMARIFLVLVLALTAFGCKKDAATTPGSDVQVLDGSKFAAAFSSAPPETKAVADSVMMSIQGSYLTKARADLDRLSNMPGVTDAQKAVVKDLSDQVDKKIAATANSAAPAQ